MVEDKDTNNTIPPEMVAQSRQSEAEVPSTTVGPAALISCAVSPPVSSPPVLLQQLVPAKWQMTSVAALRHSLEFGRCSYWKIFIIGSAIRQVDRETTESSPWRDCEAAEAECEETKIRHILCRVCSIIACLAPPIAVLL